MLNPFADRGVTPHDFIGGGLVSFSCPSMRGYRLRLYTFSREYGFLSPMVFDAKRGSARSKFEPLSLVSVLPVKWRRLIDGYDCIACSHGIAHCARIDLMFVRPSTTGQWLIGGKRKVVYGAVRLPFAERVKAAQALVE